LALTFIQVVSEVLILYAVFNIRKYIKKGLKTSQINEQNLLVHATAFLLFTLALIVEDIFFIN
jgi:hypothetical protein